MPFCIIRYRGWRVEPHWVIVEGSTDIRRMVVIACAGARIRNGGEARRVGIGEYELLHSRERTLQVSPAIRLSWWDRYIRA